FSLLAAAIGSDFWFLIDVKPSNHSDAEDLSSHSGLWRVNEGGKVYSFTADYSMYSESELRILTLHSVIVVLLPLSLVLLVFGGICGLVSSLARSPALLVAASSYFFVCRFDAFSYVRVRASCCYRKQHEQSVQRNIVGVVLYIIYSDLALALAETQQYLGPQGLVGVSTSFGWSVVLAWLSYGLEVLCGLLLLTAARKVHQEQTPPAARCRTRHPQPLATGPDPPSP
ncbi:hypothetical protein CRUP_033953, partial [Coryphaenoides rupestris]